MPSREMLRLQAEIQDAVDKEVRSVTLNIRNILIEDPPDGTPIDTGFASNNWWFNEGGPADSPSEPGPGGESRIRQDTATIANLTVDGQALHLTNNAQYIGLLNDGYSDQTPAGFVERAILTEQFANRQRKL